MFEVTVLDISVMVGTLPLGLLQRYRIRFPTESSINLCCISPCLHFLMLRSKNPAYKWEKLVISWHGDSSSDEEERRNLHELHADTCTDASAQKEFEPASLSSSLQLVPTDPIALPFWLSCLSSVHLVKSLDKAGDVWRQRGLQGFLYCRCTAEVYY